VELKRVFKYLEEIFRMKKVFLIVTAVLLVMMLAGCDGVDQPSNVVGYTDDGRAIVELELGLGLGKSARALHSTLAQAGSDFYEVIFVDSANKIYRTNWREGKVARLQVGTCDYDNTGDTDKGFAYVFAGRYSDKTLLGVGQLKSTDTNISSSTTKVDFEIEPLETDIYDTPAAVAKINAATGSTLTSTNTGFKYTSVSTQPVTIEGKTAYAFEVLTTPTTATLDLLTSLTPELYDAFLPTGTPTGGQKAYIWNEGDVKPTVLTSVGVDFDPTTAEVEFTITPASGADDGLCLIYFEVPLKLYNGGGQELGGQAAITWYYKGGLNNKLIDMGHSQMSLGGAILLATGTAMAAGPGSIEIGAEYKN